MNLTYTSNVFRAIFWQIMYSFFAQACILGYIKCIDTASEVMVVVEPITESDAERASLLAELVVLAGRDDIERLMAGVGVDVIRADIADRRRALDDTRRYGRLGAIWRSEKTSIAR